MSSRWIINAPNIRASRLRLFCIPYAGGDTWLFQRWSEHLLTDVAVCPIRLPGRSCRIAEEPFYSMEPLVAALARAIDDEGTLPYALFGHSMGALIAFELARYLNRHLGIEPAHLFVAACQAPQLPRFDPPIYQLPDYALTVELARRYGTDLSVFQSSGLMPLVLRTLRADLAVCETYVHRPGSPLRCPISTFGAVNDAMVNAYSLDAWRLQTLGSFRAHWFPGGHFFLLDSQAALLSALRKDLSRCLAKESQAESAVSHPRRLADESKDDRSA